MAILNTHAVVKKFTQHGFTEEHAELIVDAINDQSDQLATKNDLAMLKAELKADITELKSEILEVRAELKADITNVRAEISEVRSDLKAEILKVKSELKEEIKETKVDLVKWFIPLILTVLISNIAILIALFK